eukprot:scaffold11884_cov106-Isochrysis_galbana.AAC.7
MRYAIRAALGGEMSRLSVVADWPSVLALSQGQVGQFVFLRLSQGLPTEAEPSGTPAAAIARNGEWRKESQRLNFFRALSLLQLAQLDARPYRAPCGGVGEGQREQRDRAEVSGI